MKRRGTALLSCICGGMEICWIYAWLSFSMTAIMGRVISLPAMTFVFLLSAILTYLSRGQGWRVITMLGIHMVGSVCSAFFVLHALFYPSYHVTEIVWINFFLDASRKPLDWVNLILVLIWIGLIWLGGTTFARRNKVYTTTCSRFDIGLAAFFVLLLVKLALRVKGGMEVDDHVSSVLIYPYLLISLIAIGMTRVGREGSRHFLPGYGGFGVLMSIVSVVVLSASSLIFLLLPILTSVAETGQRVLKSAALWMLPVVSGVIRFMFTGGRIRPDPPSGSSPKEGLGSTSLFTDSWWTQILDKVFRWGIEIIAITFFTLASAVLIFLILKWLFSRTAINPRAVLGPDDSLPWFTQLKAFFSALWMALKNVAHGYARAAELFSVLSEWGRKSGIPRLATDTPLEFGTRLSHKFPKLKAEIEAIITALSIETYEEKMLTSEQFASALTAWRSVRSPIHWPKRLKIRLINRILTKQE